MKRILYLLSFLLVLTTASFAQQQGGERVQNLMREYIQKRLNLSKNEADRFSPLFLEYFNELRKTNTQHQGDPLIRQQKIIDLRLRYRERFKDIMGEKRSNDVFTYEKNFVDEIQKLRNEGQQNRNEKNINKRLRGH